MKLLEYKFLLILSCLFFLSVFSPVSGQNIFDWSPDYKLTKSDFMGTKGDVSSDVFTVHAASTINFSYQMSNYEFMLTKNFNSKVSTTFNRTASFIIAPDSTTENKLINFAQAEFDLQELYARKFRKSMFENKKAFSDPGFYQKLYDQVMEDYTVKVSELSQLTNLGMAETRLAEQHRQILDEIITLSEFCKECKPKKKKKGV